MRFEWRNWERYMRQLWSTKGFMSYPCLAPMVNLLVFCPILWPTVPIVCILSLETIQLFLPKDPLCILHILSSGDTLSIPYHLETSPIMLTAWKTPPIPEATAPHVSLPGCFGAPEGDSPRAWGDSLSSTSCPLKVLPELPGGQRKAGWAGLLSPELGCF